VSQVSRADRWLNSPTVLGGLGIVLALAVAEVAPRIGLVSTDVFPPISDTLRVFFDQLGESAFWTTVGQTLQGWAIGLALSFVIGVSLGALLGASRFAHAALRPSIDFLRSIPGVAILPLVILVVESNLQMKVTLIVFGSVWFFVVQTMYGVMNVDTVARDTVRSFGFGPVARARHLVLPSALPYVATALRLAGSTALAICVTVELLSGAPGLGKSILNAQSGSNNTLLYALIIAAGLLGVVVQLAFVRIEGFLLRWQPARQRLRSTRRAV
jgi:ABC-type nitrate/sulfonate/bicarbonate transport system permease component